MKFIRQHTLSLAFLAACAVPVFAQTSAPAPAHADRTSSAGKQNTAATRHVTQAIAVVQKLERDTKIHRVLADAKGVFIVPSYDKAALGVGAEGGAGILLVHRQDGSWADPVFYNAGGLSLGLQAGAQRGALVLVLNNEKAVDEFLKKNNFSLNAKAGVTVLNWNKMAQGSVGAGDVIAWSDAKGLFGDVATVEVNDIRFNQNLTNAYYNRTLSATDVIAGKLNNPQAEPLLQALVAVADTGH